MSYLQTKSNILTSVAKLLHDKSYYPAVAHGAYYSCYQLSKHIWLYRIGKSQDELDRPCSTSMYGSHEVLINEVGKYINEQNRINKVDHVRIFKSKILQLKKLQIQADYDDTVFDSSKSQHALSLSYDVLQIVTQYQ